MQLLLKADTNRKHLSLSNCRNTRDFSHTIHTCHQTQLQSFIRCLSRFLLQVVHCCWANICPESCGKYSAAQRVNFLPVRPFTWKTEALVTTAEADGITQGFDKNSPDRSNTHTLGHSLNLLVFGCQIQNELIPMIFSVVGWLICCAFHVLFLSFPYSLNRTSPVLVHNLQLRKQLILFQQFPQ